MVLRIRAQPVSHLPVMHRDLSKNYNCRFLQLSEHGIKKSFIEDLTGRQPPIVAQLAFRIDGEAGDHQLAHAILRPFFDFHVVRDCAIGVIELGHGSDLRVEIAAMPVLQFNLLPARGEPHAVREVAGL